MFRFLVVPSSQKLKTTILFFLFDVLRYKYCKLTYKIFIIITIIYYYYYYYYYYCYYYYFI